MKLPRWIRRVKEAAKWLDKHLLTVGGWKIRPIAKYLNPKKENNQGYFPRKEK